MRVPSGLLRSVITCLRLPSPRPHDLWTHCLDEPANRVAESQRPECNMRISAMTMYITSQPAPDRKCSPFTSARESFSPCSSFEERLMYNLHPTSFFLYRP